MRPLPLTEWDESLEHVLSDMNGQPLNVHSLMANHPDLLNAWWNYRNYSVRGGDLQQRDCEHVILRVAVHMRCWYEWASHVDRGLAAGLQQDEIDRVLDGPDAPGWRERDRLLLRAVDELVEDSAVHSSTLKHLSTHFSSQQILDLVSLQGVYFTLGCMVNTWNPELDEHVVARLPDGTTRDGFEARLPS